MRFELDRLVDYGDAELLAELKRVARSVGKPTLTKSAFDCAAKVSSHTLMRRFGGWREALEAADLGHLYGGRMISDKMRRQDARGLTNDEVVAEMRRVASILGANVLTKEQLDQHSSSLSASAVRARFGSWKEALRVAGLRESNHARRYTDDECFENLLTVWTHYGRPPKHREMRKTPSVIPGKSYELKWGRWSKALQAFIERVNSDTESSAPAEPTPAASAVRKSPKVPADERREIRIGLRYAVLKRDHFRCVACGASPAINPGCVLHVDHIVAFSKGGKTVLENLRALCERCNIGKSDGPA